MFPRMLRFSLLGAWAVLAAFASAQEPEGEKVLPPVEKSLPRVVPDTPPIVPPAAPATPQTPIVSLPLEAAAPCCVPTCEKTFPIKRVQIAEVTEAITVPRLPVREEITKVPFIGTDIEYREEKLLITYLVTKTRTEQREVQSMSVVPETTVDPCTGCSCTTYKQVPVCRCVPVEVVDVVPETKLCVIKVPVLKCVEKLAVVKQIRVDQTTAPAALTKFQAVETSTQVTVPLPMPCPPGPAPARPDCAHGHCH